MDITADRVQRMCTSTYLLEKQFQTIMKTFQSEIIDTGKSGGSEVVVSVPTNFDIPGMNNALAQTIIYHKIIEDLETNGFSVKMSMDTDTTTYWVGWGDRTDAKDLEYMRNTIASHIIKSGDSKKR